MNRKSIDQIFKAYIDKFEYLNDSHNNENYKWHVICEYQRLFDIDAPDFASMLRKVQDATDNTIDSYTQPFFGLVKIAEEEPEPIRDAFRALYVPDGGDLAIRQSKIDAFLTKCNELVEKYYPGSYLYKNDQRSAMAYLFFNDPDNHYLYKATEAKYLASCVGFYDDWGSMSEFKLDVYHRFCDELIAEIKATPALLDTHYSRFDAAKVSMHKDEPLHVLAFDIIYCAHTYGLYSGLDLTKVTAADRKLYQERKAKAQELLAAVEKAEIDMQMLSSAKRYFTGLIQSGAAVTHKMFGAVDVEAMDDGMLTLRIRKNGEQKRFGMLFSIANGFIKIDAVDFAEKVSQYKMVMLREMDIPRSLESAQKALQPYNEYLN